MMHVIHLVLGVSCLHVVCRFNNIFHCHFYALYQELLQRGGWNRLNIIKNTKLVSRMVKEYDPEAKIGAEIFLLPSSWKQTIFPFLVVGSSSVFLPDTEALVLLSFLHADNRGHIIYLAKLLMDCEDARVQFYLQGHCHWREFLPIVESAPFLSSPSSPISLTTLGSQVSSFFPGAQALRTFFCLRFLCFV